MPLGSGNNLVNATYCSLAAAAAVAAAVPYLSAVAVAGGQPRRASGDAWAPERQYNNENTSMTTIREPLL